jgi:hypothetical protein
MERSAMRGRLRRIALPHGFHPGYGRGDPLRTLAIGVRDGVTGGIATTVGIALAQSPAPDELAIARRRIAKGAEEKTGLSGSGVS